VRELATKLLMVLSLFAFGSAGVFAQDTAPKVGTKFGAWVFQCQAVSAERNVCGLVQTVVETKSKRQVLRAVVRAFGKEQKLGLFVTLPLGIYLAPGIAGKVDKGEQFKFVLQVCNQAGCEAAARVDDKLKKALQVGKQLIVAFKPNPKSKAVGVGVSLEGFTAGIKHLTS
jgi:invasion protein IalB